jgi:hypothetical protein
VPPERQVNGLAGLGMPADSHAWPTVAQAWAGIQGRDQLTVRHILRIRVKGFVEGLPSDTLYLSVLTIGEIAKETSTHWKAGSWLTSTRLTRARLNERVMGLPFLNRSETIADETQRGLPWTPLSSLFPSGSLQESDKKPGWASCVP